MIERKFSTVRKKEGKEDNNHEKFDGYAYEKVQ